MAGIGEQIREARRAKGWTQDQLAGEISTTRQTISNYEAGRRLPDGETLLRISRALNCRFEADGAAPAEQMTVSQAAQAAAETAPAALSPAVKARRKHAPYLIAAALVCIALLLWLTAPHVLRNGGGPAATGEDGKTWTAAQFRQTAENRANQAYLRLVPSVEVMEGDAYDYWLYSFAMYEENGIALSIDRVEEFIFGAETVTHRTYGAGDFRAAGLSTEIAARGEWRFDGGFPVQDISGVGLLVSATDASGAALTFTGYLPLSGE